MPTISPILPNDGESIDASDVNNPFNTIIGLLNGNLDEQNIKPGSLSWNVMSNFQNQIPSAALQDGANLGKFKKDANISFISEGLIWSQVTGLNASMTAGKYYSNTGNIISITAISSKTFNSNKDTYIYVGQNGTINYGSVDNNAARPSLPANSSWLAKVVTNDSAITYIADMRQTQLVGAHNIDFKAIFAAKSYNENQTVGNVFFQTGWTQFIGNVNPASNKRFVAPVVFPQNFSKVYSVLCCFIGYKIGSAATKMAEFNNVVGEGNVVEPADIAGTGFNIVASSRGGMGAAWHGVTWFAVGEA